MKQQKGKHKKREKGWHRGRVEQRKSARTTDRLPDVDSGADPTQGGPIPLIRRGKGTIK